MSNLNKEQFAFIVYEQAPMDFIEILTGVELEVLEELNDNELQSLIESKVNELSQDQIKAYEENYII